ncbi:MAG: hypothetical protein NXI08_11445 [bacterium]|nr:hypothetical protein [bacterium]
MGIFNKSSTKAPHLQHPEILHWKEGDIIRARNVKAKGIFSKLNALETGALTRNYEYKGITSDGFIIVEDEADKEIHKTDLQFFLKKAENLSLKNRTILTELDTSSEYMELIAEFQKAYMELSDQSEESKLLNS